MSVSRIVSGGVRNDGYYSKVNSVVETVSFKYQKREDDVGDAKRIHISSTYSHVLHFLTFVLDLYRS